MEHLGIGFIDAVRDLAQRGRHAGAPRTTAVRRSAEREKAQKQRQATLTEVLAKAGQHYRQQLKANPRAIEYLKGRGLTGQIALQFGLGLCARRLAPRWPTPSPSYDDPLLVETGMVIPAGRPRQERAEQRRYDRFRDRVMFPIRNVLRRSHRLRRPRAGQGRAQVPELAGDAGLPQGPRALRPLRGPPGDRAGAATRWWSRATWTSWRWRSTASATRSRRWARPARRSTCRSCSASPSRWCSASTATPPGAARPGARSRPPCPTPTRRARSSSCSCRPSTTPIRHVRELGADAFERCVEGAVPLSRQLMETAADGCDLGTPEGRAKMLSVAKPLWAALPDGLLKRQLLGELARRAQLPDAELQALWANAQPPAAPGSRPRAERPAAPPKAAPRTVAPRCRRRPRRAVLRHPRFRLR